MTKALVVFATVSGLAMSTALAQAPTPPSPAPATPSTNATPSNSQIVNSQTSDEWLASKLKGMTVVGSDNQKIGDVVDILLDKSGQVKAFIVGVGGVLGLGAKEVAVELTQLATRNS
jgi:sporulation protein YlmC with PRC-barrel domain